MQTGEVVHSTTSPVCIAANMMQKSETENLKPKCKTLR